MPLITEHGAGHGSAHQSAQHDATHGGDDTDGLGAADARMLEGRRERQCRGRPTRQRGGAGKHAEQQRKTEKARYRHAQQPLANRQRSGQPQKQQYLSATCTQ